MRVGSCRNANRHGAFTKVGQGLKTKKDILILIRAFRMSLMLYGLSVSGPGSRNLAGIWVLFKYLGRSKAP